MGRSAGNALKLTMFCVVVAIGVAGCGGDGEESSSAASGSATQAGTENKRLTFAFINALPISYYNHGVEAAQMAAKELNVDLKVLQSQGDAGKELANIQTAIAQHVDGIMLFSASSNSLKGGMTQAHNADIPVALLDSNLAWPDLTDVVDLFHGADEPQLPIEVAQWVGKEIGSGPVGEIQGFVGGGDAELYHENFTKELAREYPDIKVVASPVGDWDRAKARAGAQDILTAHPDVKLIFVHNEDMAIGAISALRDADKLKKVKLIAQNGSPEGLEQMQEGNLQATMSWSSAQEAVMALNRLAGLVRGEDVGEQTCLTPHNLVTKENIGDAVPWEATPELIAEWLTTPCA
jgi:ABC-type sugar transport system substrate-binding protein